LPDALDQYVSIYLQYFMARHLEYKGCFDSLQRVHSLRLGSPGKAMPGLTVSHSSLAVDHFSHAKHTIVTVENFLEHPEQAIDQASLQNFARISDIRAAG